MLIDRSALSLASSYRKTIEIHQESRLEGWVGDRPAADSRTTPAATTGATMEEQATRLRLSAEALARLASTSPPAAEADAAPNEAGSGDQATGATSVGSLEERANGTPEGVRLEILRQILEEFTGRAIRLVRAEDFEVGEAAAAPPEGTIDGAATAEEGQAAPQRAGWGLTLDATSTRIESEQLTFAAKGSIRTADGEEVSFSLNLQLSRQTVSREELHLRAGDAVMTDPLVLDFSGAGAALGPQRFAFDLRPGGATEQLRTLATGRAYLVLDRDGDGLVKDGSELFGPATNDGFSELAALDADGNRWIDEADPGWSMLRLWRPDGAGQGTLTTLAEQGVGALSVENVAAPFELQDAAGARVGKLRSAGLYLDESGRAGALQQVDLEA